MPLDEPLHRVLSDLLAYQNWWNATSPAADAEFKESDHPRGQPGNAGQFGAGGGGSGNSVAELKAAHAKLYQQHLADPLNKEISAQVGKAYRAYSEARKAERGGTPGKPAAGAPQAGKPSVATAPQAKPQAAPAPAAASALKGSANTSEVAKGVAAGLKKAMPGLQHFTARLDKSRPGSIWVSASTAARSNGNPVTTPGETGSAGVAIRIDPDKVVHFYEINNGTKTKGLGSKMVDGVLKGLPGYKAAVHVDLSGGFWEKIANRHPGTFDTAADQVPMEAAGLVLRKGPQVLFVRHAERGSWEFPGGMVEPGETPEQAAQREAIEEAGAPDGLHLYHVADIDHADVHYALFTADAPDDFRPTLADGELNDWLWTSPESPPEPLHAGLPEALDCLALDAHPRGLAADAQLAFDRSVRSYDANGHLHVTQSNISKANICEYYGHEIPGAEELGLDPNRRYRLYRDPEELAKATPTFNRLPILCEHQPVSADEFPEDLICGTTGSDAVFEHPYLRNSLSIWKRDAIDGIENEDSKQLSSAYRYRADMTPGVIDGQRYDGVMRDIAGNHVALVPEGRAGADVVVGDSKPKETTMPAARTTAGRMSRQALFISAACAAAALPLLATDQQMPDLRPLLKGVTAKNWKTKRPTFIIALDKLLKPRLAKDDSIDALAALLNRLEVDGAGPEEVEDQLEPINGENQETGVTEDPPPNEEATDHGGLPEQIAKKLEEWLTPEQMAELRAMAGGTTEPPPDDTTNGGDQETDPDDTTRTREEDEDMRNKPGTPPAMDQAAVKKVVDAAVAADRLAERTRYKALREAEVFVRPWIGEIAIAQDTAEATYKLALTTLGYNVADDVHPSAYRHILAAQPKPSERLPDRSSFAMDAGQSKDFAERYPGATRLKHAS